MLRVQMPTIFLELLHAHCCLLKLSKTYLLSTIMSKLLSSRPAPQLFLRLLQLFILRPLHLCPLFVVFQQTRTLPSSFFWLLFCLFPFATLHFSCPLLLLLFSRFRAFLRALTRPVARITLYMRVLLYELCSQLPYRHPYMPARCFPISQILCMQTTPSTFSLIDCCCFSRWLFQNNWILTRSDRLDKVFLWAAWLLLLSLCLSSAISLVSPLVVLICISFDLCWCLLFICLPLLCACFSSPFLLFHFDGDAWWSQCVVAIVDVGALGAQAEASEAGTLLAPCFPFDMFCFVLPFMHSCPSHSHAFSSSTMSQVEMAGVVKAARDARSYVLSFDCFQAQTAGASSSPASSASFPPSVELIPVVPQAADVAETSVEEPSAYASFFIGIQPIPLVPDPDQDEAVQAASPDLMVRRVFRNKRGASWLLSPICLFRHFPRAIFMCCMKCSISCRRKIQQSNSAPPLHATVTRSRSWCCCPSSPDRSSLSMLPCSVCPCTSSVWSNCSSWRASPKSTQQYFLRLRELFIKCMDPTQSMMHRACFAVFFVSQFSHCLILITFPNFLPLSFLFHSVITIALSNSFFLLLFFPLSFFCLCSSAFPVLMLLSLSSLPFLPACFLHYSLTSIVFLSYI